MSKDTHGKGSHKHVSIVEERSSSDSPPVEKDGSAGELKASPLLLSVPPPPQPSVTQRALEEAVSGLGGAVFSALCIYPIDFIKTRLQLPGCPFNSLSSGFMYVVQNEGFTTLYRGIDSEILKGSIQNFCYFYYYYILKEAYGNFLLRTSKSSVSSLSSHHTPPLKAAAFNLLPDQGIKWTDDPKLQIEYYQRQVEKLKLKLTAKHKNNPSLTPSLTLPAMALMATGTTLLPIKSLSPESTALTTSTSPAPSSTPKAPPLSIMSTLALGVIAGCLTQLVVNPLSVVQTRIMTNKTGSGGGLLKTGWNIFQTEGISAFFSGILPAFILSTNPAIQFLVFDRSKALLLRILSQRMTPRSLSPLESFLLGAFAKIVATIVTYPYIMAKVRLQWKGEKESALSIPYKGTMDVIIRTLKSEGVFGLYRGLQAQMLKSVLGAALMFMAKEQLNVWREWLMRWRERRIHQQLIDNQQQQINNTTHNSNTA